MNTAAAASYLIREQWDRRHGRPRCRQSRTREETLRDKGSSVEMEGVDMMDLVHSL